MAAIRARRMKFRIRAALTHEYGDQIKSTISEGVKNYFVLKYL
jgi:hypothetical protein